MDMVDEIFRPGGYGMVIESDWKLVFDKTKPDKSPAGTITFPVGKPGPSSDWSRCRDLFFGYINSIEAGTEILQKWRPLY